MIPFRTIALLLALCLAGCAGATPMQAPTNAASTLEVDAAFVGAPRLFGLAGADRVVILYTNPQCLPCKRTWPLLRDVLHALGPQRVTLIVQGRGFSDAGTRLLFVAAAVGAQDAPLGFALFDAVMRGGTEMYIQGWRWVETWLDSQDPQGRIDRERLLAVTGSPQAAAAYLAGVERVEGQYGLTHTPALIIDGRPHQGPHTGQAVREALAQPLLP